MQLNDQLDRELARLRTDCTDILGALVITPEGLVLAGAGAAGGDAAAAAASHLADTLDDHLGLLAAGPCRETVMWTATGLWGLARLPSRHVLLTQACASCSAATLRLALGRLRASLGPLLADVPVDAQG